MAEHLINHRFDLAMLQNVLQVVLQKIGDSDRPYFTCFIGFFKCAPNLNIFAEIVLCFAAPFLPRLRSMDNNEVEIIKPGLTEDIADSLFSVCVAFCFGGNFAGDKEFFTRYAASPDTFPDTGFIVVSLW